MSHSQPLRGFSAKMPADFVNNHRVSISELNLSSLAGAAHDFDCSD